MKIAWSCGLLLLAASVRADVVQLANGQTVKGRVLTYGNGRFEVADDTGAISKYTPNTVKRIEFDGGIAVMDTRMKGRLQGTISRFEDAAFTIQTTAGKTEQVAAMLVNEISFSGGGASGKKIDTITHGARVDVAKHLVRGQVTIVDFYADWCGPCRTMAPVLEKLAKDNAQVVVRKVDIVRWGTPVAQQYNINSIPHIEIYDREAKLVGTITGVDPEGVQRFVKQAKAAK